MEHGVDVAQPLGEFQPFTGKRVIECNQVNHLIPTRVLVKGGKITCKILK
ncbi:hypothetical protein GZE01_003839 [Escherichia coli]|nr:hypothetical protein [Escherichia coli]